jgi:hypothetical protein
MTGTTSGAGTAHPSEATDIFPGVSWVRVSKSLDFCVVFYGLLLTFTPSATFFVYFLNFHNNGCINVRWFESYFTVIKQLVSISRTESKLSDI